MTSSTANNIKSKIFPPFSSDKYRFGFNGKELDNEIQGDGNSYDFGARIYDSRLGRWLSLDPLQAKYPSFSPYNYCTNNPIVFIDPDGKEVIIHGEDKYEAFTALQKTTSLTLAMDVNGKITAKIPEPTIDKETGFPLAPSLSKWDMALYDAFKDPKVEVNLYTTKAQFYDSKDGGKNIPISPAGYEGSVVNGGKIETTQIINMDMVQTIEDAGLDNSGMIVGHEILESFFGGKDNPGGDYKSGYKPAHTKAKPCEDKPAENDTYNSLNTTTGVTDVGYQNKDGSVKVKLTDSTKMKDKFVKE